jgi:D-sedoheptulose 7-phosphate isomerase
MTLAQEISQEFQEAQKVLQNFMASPENFEKIALIAQQMATCLTNGGKIISCGNGGSHCDAMHFAEELSGRYRADRPSLAAIAISDISHTTCVGNDYGFNYIFSRFIEGLGQANDILLAISTSGNSQNIIEAVKSAKAKGMKVVLLLGKDGGQLASESDLSLIVPHFGFADRIQEVHIKVIHSLIFAIEKLVANKMPI